MPPTTKNQIPYNMNKEIRNINSKGDLHGYQVRYLIGVEDTLLVRTNMRNNKIIGYHEYHVDNKQTTYYHIR